MAALKSLLSSKPKSDEQIKWSKEAAEEWKVKVRELAGKLQGLEVPRILFIGETGSGKSSFISSIVSALCGHITFTSTIGEHEGREENTSKRYLEHRVFMGDDEEPLSFIMCDARGIAKENQEGVARREIYRLIEGKLRHNDLMESDRGATDGLLIDDREPRPPSCVVFVQKAQRLGHLDKDVNDKLKMVMSLIRERGIPSCAVVTHIDVVKPSLNNKLHLALGSAKIQDRVERAAKEVGVKTSRVFVVKNYTDERRTHTRHDILILRALHGILLDVYRRQREHATRQTVVRQQSAPLFPLGQDTMTNLSMRPMSEGPGPYFGRAPSQLSMDSGPNTSVSQQIPHTTEDLDHVQMRTKSAAAAVYHHHQRYSSEPVQTRYASPAGYGDPPQFKDERQNPGIEYQSPRGSQYFRYDVPRDPTEEGSKSDNDDYSYDDLGDADEGVGDSLILDDPQETTAPYQKPGSFLQAIVNRLSHNSFPDDYKEEAALRGAKPLYTPRVLQRNGTNKTTSESDKTLALQLPKSFEGEDPQLHEQLRVELKAWCRANGSCGSASVWMSYTLPVDMGLPLDVLPPESIQIQAFFLAPGHPAMLLTVYSPSEATLSGGPQPSAELDEETELVQMYALQESRLLTTAILNYCCCDFVLLPCLFPLADLTADGLAKEAQRQESACRAYYGGPVLLSEATYRQLKEASIAVCGGTPVPRWLLRDCDEKINSEEEEELVVMDPDWRGAVSLLIETLTVSADRSLTYPSLARVKVATAVVEAARRLSFMEDVLLVTGNQQVLECCKMLKDKVFEDTGITIRLSLATPDDQSPTEGSYVILLDCPDYYRLDSAESMVLRVSEFSEQTLRKQRLP